jgi:hypothetical protein
MRDPDFDHSVENFGIAGHTDECSRRSPVALGLLPIIPMGVSLMTTTFTDSAEQARRAELVDNSRRATQQGATLEKRTQAREAKADEWSRWFHRKIDTAGGDPLQYLPDALGELEERITDSIAAEMRQLKAALTRALMSERTAEQWRAHVRLLGRESLTKGEIWRMESTERAEAWAAKRAADAEIRHGRAIETSAAEQLRGELTALQAEHQGLVENFVEASRGVCMGFEGLGNRCTDLEKHADETPDVRDEMSRLVSEAAGQLRSELQTASEGSHNALLTALRTVSEGLERTVREEEHRRDDVIRNLESRISKIDAEFTELRTAAAKQRFEELVAVHQAMVATVAATVDAIGQKRAELVAQTTEQREAVEVMKAEVAGELEALRAARSKKFKFARERKFSREKRAAEALELPVDFTMSSRSVQ